MSNSKSSPQDLSKLFEAILKYNEIKLIEKNTHDLWLSLAKYEAQKAMEKKDEQDLEAKKLRQLEFENAWLKQKLAGNLNPQKLLVQDMAANAAKKKKK